MLVYRRGPSVKVYFVHLRISNRSMSKRLAEQILYGQLCKERPRNPLGGKTLNTRVS